MKDNKNEFIGCTVENCKYHCNGSDYCARQGIEVGSCNCHAESSDNTYCQSFEAKNNYSY